MVNFTSTMNVNFSSFFQSAPISPATALSQIAALPVTGAKIFSHDNADLAFMKAVQARKALTLAVGCTNAELAGLAAGNTQNLVNVIGPFADVVAWVCVGNEPLGSWFDHQYDRLLAPALDNVAKAFGNAGLKIGVTVPQNFEFMQTSYPPSAGSIKPEFVDIIRNTCAVMRNTGAPFMVNIYPFLTRIQNRNDVPLDYCLFNAPPNQWVKDGSYTYKNIFDAMIDALHVALGKIGYGDLEIVIGECGWPSRGDQDATPTFAQTFNQGLVRHCKSGAGSPRLPGRQFRCFVFEMYDEDRKPTGPGAFEPYWGVYDGTGKPKYSLQW